MRSVAIPMVMVFLSSPIVAADPTALKSVWEFETPGGMPQAVAVDEHGGRHLFVAMKSHGLMVLQLNGNAPPKPVAKLGVSAFSNQDVMHLVQRGELLFVALGDLHAIKGAPAGLAVLNVARPATPKVLDVWTSPEVLNGSAVVTADAKHAYLGAMSAGVMVFDITTPSKIRHVTTFQPEVNFPRAQPNKLQHPNARGLLLLAKTLYVAYDAGGIRVLDVSDPSKPIEVGLHVNSGMGMKQQAYNSLAQDGDLLYVATDYAGLEILNVKKPGHIQRVGWWNPWKADGLGNIWANSPGHTNQIALDRKRKRVYLSAGDSDLRVVDVSDPRKPALTQQYGEPKDGRGTWGVTLSERTAYLTYIQPPLAIPFRGTWSGVVAIDVK